jgi:hypothetical protein
MKNLIVIVTVMLCFAFCTVQDAQSQSILMAGSGDTIVNTGAKSVSQKFTTTANVVSFQAVVSKVSGTVAGTAVLQASNNDTTWVTISTDTLTLTDVAVNSKVWNVPNNPYVSYRILYTGSGTMAAVARGWAVRR